MELKADLLLTRWRFVSLFLLEFLFGFHDHPQLVIFGDFRNEEDCFARVVVDEGQAVGLFHAEEVPEGGFLFGQIVDIVVIFVDGLDAFQQSD